jgi:predicted metal-dependent hydrolase
MSRRRASDVALQLRGIDTIRDLSNIVSVVQGSPVEFPAGFQQSTNDLERGHSMRPVRAAAQPSQKLRVNGLIEPVEIRRHPAARRMTLRVSRTSRSVIVTVPVSCDLAQAGTFLNSHLDWVRERLGNLPAHIPFADGSVVPLRGTPHVIVEVGPRRSGAVVQSGTTGDGKPALLVSGLADHVPRRLRDWLAAEAGRDLCARVSWHGRNLGLKPGRVTVRDQKSRWGSCSTTRALSFSWRLIMAPSFVLDYVAAHEVAHLAEMNHGPRFWALVERTMPQTAEAKHWLQAYGSDLHRYGAEE